MDIIYHVVIWYIQIRSILSFWGGTWWWKTTDSIVYRETTNSMQKSSFQKIYISLSIDWFINRFILLLLSHFSHVQLFVTPWTVVHQAPLSMGFSRQEYWSGLPFPSPGELPDPGIEPRSPILQTDALLTELCGKPVSKGLRSIRVIQDQPILKISAFWQSLELCFNTWVLSFNIFLNRDPSLFTLPQLDWGVKIYKSWNCSLLTKTKHYMVVNIDLQANHLTFSLDFKNYSH